MNKLSTEDRVRVISALVEGCSIRSTVRMTGVAKNTIAKLLVELGEACGAYHNDHVRGLTCQRVQCDEIWSFCHAKQKNVPTELQGKLGHGDVWTFVALDADKKLIISHLVGRRSSEFARDLMLDLADRVVNRFQLTTDGLNKYPAAVEDAFNGDIDYARLIKVYAADRTGEARYSPPICIAAERKPVTGNPDPDHISTSHVERSNLTMRMQMRRYTRLTNGFSKKFENHIYMTALHFMHYNFCRVHQTLRVTPAMEAGLADHVWELEELVGLLG